MFRKKRDRSPSPRLGRIRASVRAYAESPLYSVIAVCGVIAVCSGMFTVLSYLSKPGMFPVVIFGNLLFVIGGYLVTTVHGYASRQVVEARGECDAVH